MMFWMMSWVNIYVIIYIKKNNRVQHCRVSLKVCYNFGIFYHLHDKPLSLILNLL